MVAPRLGLEARVAYVIPEAGGRPVEVGARVTLCARSPAGERAPPIACVGPPGSNLTNAPSLLVSCTAVRAAGFPIVRLRTKDDLVPNRDAAVLQAGAEQQQH